MTTTTKKHILAAALLAIAGGAFADEPATPAHQVSGTITVASDYIFRGLTQTWHEPAVQASLDYAHAPSGVYASLWTSTVSKKVIAGAHAEVDLVLGIRRAVGDQWNYGAGLISIYYPGGNWNRMRWGPRPDKRYDFTELNAFVGYQAVTLKYSQAVDDLFGFSSATGFSDSTRRSSYVELNADLPLADTGLVLGLHAGHQDIKATANGIDPDFNDYRVSLTRAFAGGWSGSLQLTGNSNTAFFDGTMSNLDENARRDVGKRRAVLIVSRTF